MCRSLRRLVEWIGLFALILGVGQAMPVHAAPLANTCNGASELSYPTAPNFSAIGDTVHVVIALGAGDITTGANLSLSINRVKFDLDCQASNLGINCLDDGPAVSYQANLTSTCPGGFTTTSVAGDTLPNQVVFIPGAPIVIPANTPNFCRLEFDVKIEARGSNDGTPDVLEEVSGFDASTQDGVCNTVPPLAAGNTNSGSITLCPQCDDGNQCNGVETCDPATGCQPGTPITCDDHNKCTTDSCDPATGCVNTPGALDCDDHNKCTTDTCDPATGCVNTPGALDCDDHNKCTTDTCDPATGCQHTPGALDCDDHDKCTTDTCDPATGCVHTPGALDCDDHDKCTTDTCDPATGCVHTPGALNCDDNDPCTDDSCDPATGCQHVDNGQCNLICRTPGFWGTHADTDPAKACSQDITGAVIALAGGSISVCGECISNSNLGETLGPNDAASAEEALCVRVQGQSQRQLARQLTAAALNCIISASSSATCANTSVIDWATCNAVCQGTSTAKTVGECIDEIDAFNNGIGTGCHDRDLPLDTIFPAGTRCTRNGQLVQGPAGSNDECNRANDSACTIIQPNESRCASDSCP